MILVETKEWWRSNQAVFKLTDEEIEVADKRNDGYIGRRYGIGCYITRMLDYDKDAVGMVCCEMVTIA